MPRPGGGDDFFDDPANQPPSPPAQPSAPANPAFDANKFKQDLTALYQKYYRRDPTVEEIQAHSQNPGGLAAIEQMLAATPNFSQAPAPTSDTGGGGTGGGDLMARIKAELAKAQSTDDPQYWFDHISKDPNGAGSAWAFWQDRIARGDGALAVRNGTVQRFNDSPSGGGGTTPFAGYGGGNPAGFGAPPAPYQSAPYAGGQYTTPALPAGLQQPFTPATYTAPTFTPPTGIDMQNDPGYQARLQLGQQTLERSAAARGSVLSGGFQQALNNYAQDYASNEYGNVYNRALGTFSTNAGNAFNAFNANTSNQFGARQQQYGEYQGAVGNAQAQYGNRYSAYLNDQSRMLNDYLTNYNIGHTAQTDYWGRLRDLSGQGLDAARSSRVQ